MIQRKRSRLSPTEKADIWRRWKCGQSMHEIGRVHGRPHPTIRKLLLPHGGITPVPHRRSRLALTLAEREDISRGIASGSSIREIASRLDRAASTVSREIARHGGRSAYRAHDADDQAWVSALRPKRCLLAMNRCAASLRVTDAGLVARADFRVAEEPLFRQREHARVPRDHLPQPIHPSAGRIEKRADGPSAVKATHAPLPSFQRAWTLTGADR